MSSGRPAPTLIMLCGLPGAGKSTLAEALAPRLGACVLAVDVIEDAVLRAGLPRSFETGLAAYLAATALAERQLAMGLSVIADAGNYVEVAREAWARVAESAGVPLRIILVECSDPALHRERLASRRRGMAAEMEPSWDDVTRRVEETAPLATPHLRVDSIAPLADMVAECVEYLAR